MTIDITPFQEFLESVAQVSEYKLQVWDHERLLFSTGGNPVDPPFSEENRDFAAQVMNLAAFQCGSGNGKGAMYGVPINNGRKVLGSLVAYTSRPDKKSQTKKDPFRKTVNPSEMERFLKEVAGLIHDKWTSQRESEELAEELSQSFEDLYLYSKLGTQIKTLQVSSSMLEELLTKLLENMRCDLAFAELPHRQEHNTLVTKQDAPEWIPDCEAFIQDLLRSIPQNSPSLKDHYFIVPDSRLTSGYGTILPQPYRFLAVQIRHNGTFYGWLGLAAINVEEIFRQGELRLLISIAEQIGVVIANTDLYRNLERFVINTVRSLVQAIEAKDHYTRGHSERVSRYCKLIAKRLKLDKQQKASLLWASILHDVGKISIGEHILNKKEPLSDDEWAIIKGHPGKGLNILKPLDDLSESLPGIFHHHERWDGEGYPEGLKGEEIPLQARIIAVADTFDAITTARPYREAASPQEALAIMQEVRGTQLDAELVELFTEEVNTKLGLITETSQEQKGYRNESSVH